MFALLTFIELFVLDKTLLYQGFRATIFTFHVSHRYTIRYPEVYISFGISLGYLFKIFFFQILNNSYMT